MPLFMNVHAIEAGPRVDAVAQAHTAGLQTQAAS